MSQFSVCARTLQPRIPPGPLFSSYANRYSHVVFAAFAFLAVQLNGAEPTVSTCLPGSQRHKGPPCHMPNMAVSLAALRDALAPRSRTKSRTNITNMWCILALPYDPDYTFVPNATIARVFPGIW